jgi:fibronectin type III domain protein
MPAVVVAGAALFVSHLAADRGTTAPRPTPVPASASQASPTRRVTTATASGVIRFSDLIEQDRRRPQRALAPRRPEGEEEESRERNVGSDSSEVDVTHPAFEPPMAASTGPSPAPALTFGAVQGSSTVPPDSTGAVGPLQVLTVTNHGLQVHSKTGAFIGAITTWTFWQMFNPAFPFDPRVIYDPVQQRFIIIALDYRSNGQTSYDGSIYIAVSHTGDVLGGWTLRKYLSCVAANPCSSSNAGAVDFPMVGLSQNFLAISVVGNRTYVFSYPALRQTQGQAPVSVLDAAGPGYVDFWGAPVVNASATDGDLYFVKSNTGATGDFRLNRLTGPPDAPSFIPGPLITVPSHLAQVGCIPANAPQAPEPGTGNIVPIVNVPVNSDAVARDDYVWFTESRRVQAADCGGNARVLWLKFHKSGTFVDGGVIEDATGKWFMYPTIAVNRFHDVLVGFTQTSGSEYASAAYAFRAGTDQAGTMRDARVYKPGEGHFNLPYSAGIGRWGDYSHTVVDPSDDTTLWTIQEYARAQVGTGAGSGRWGTWWAAVNPRAPQAPGAPQTLTASATGSSVLLTWGAPSDGGAPTSYSVEAGSGPGSSNLANFPTGNTALSFVAGGVPDGTYYVRVRASNALGVSPPSNEATLVVGCTSAPGAPAGLTIVTNSGGAVALAWQAAPGGATSYIIEAGTATGLANLLALDLGSANLGLAASGVGAGTYFVRVRGLNRCGAGPASNEVVLVVS